MGLTDQLDERTQLCQLADELARDLADVTAAIAEIDRQAGREDLTLASVIGDAEAQREHQARGAAPGCQPWTPIENGHPSPWRPPADDHRRRMGMGVA